MYLEVNINIKDYIDGVHIKCKIDSLTKTDKEEKDIKM